MGCQYRIPGEYDCRAPFAPPPTRAQVDELIDIANKIAKDTRCIACNTWWCNRGAAGGRFF